ncbi:mannonate dehydratase [Demequina zhanjiangensis]|uniref:Mannonate dehydratase n=1 Tax=Demequina zhanjiangensis TaxID=3051659 RepID=A0ABT8G1P5_9MICO|nr:mannonate dehydratase [Demequina sp. SYSU T00b26]MDN4473048.1 mannonate dehydratase [Demequina sp. SYSU T00b26]
MEKTWRWYGPEDSVTLTDVRQTDATGVVTALHHLPNGVVWPVDEIRKRQQECEDNGLYWSIVESVPVHEDIRRGLPARDGWIDKYCQTIRNLAECGVDMICYNFMPALDWTRTDLDWPLANGGTALRYDADAVAAFDMWILNRPGAEDDFTDARKASARAWLDAATPDEVDKVTTTLLAGLPGSEESYTVEEFREALAAYDGLTHESMRGNLKYFLERIIPVAEEVGVRMAIHPDDPPFDLFGIPRVVSTMEDAQWLLDAVPSPANGLTLCVGSYGVRGDNDVVEMARRFADRIYFSHLRSTRREEDPESFHEAVHIDGDIDIVGVVRELVREERRRGEEGPRISIRSDHGHRLLDDLTRKSAPGYPLIGRMKGLAEVRGVELAVNRGLDGDLV